jgi:hypothetical protein
MFVMFVGNLVLSPTMKQDETILKIGKQLTKLT